MRRPCTCASRLASRTRLQRSHFRSASGDAWKEGNIDYTGARAAACGTHGAPPYSLARGAGTLMVVTLKLISTAFDYADGAARETAALTPHQRDARLASLPSPLAYLVRSCAQCGTRLCTSLRGGGVRTAALRWHARAHPQGYVLYPGTLLAGPWLSFADYQAFIQRTGVRMRLRTRGGKLRGGAAAL